MKSLFFVLPALLLGLTACGAPVAAVTLPDTVQVEKTQTAETAVLYEDADGREVSPRRAALTEWRWSVADDTIAEVDPSGIVTGLRGGSTTLTLQSADEEEFDQLLHGGEFTLALTEITALYNDAAAYLDMWRSGNSCNYAQIGMNAYDILMRVAAASTSDEARDAYLKDAEGLLLDGANVVPLYGRQQPYQMAENVIGAVSDGLGAWYFGTTRRLAK